MAGINKVILIGNLGRDPELKFTQGGTAVCNLNLATTRSYTKGGQGGERVEETEWHRVVVWGKDAENANKYLAKGRQLERMRRTLMVLRDKLNDGAERAELLDMIAGGLAG